MYKSEKENIEKLAALPISEIGTFIDSLSFEERAQIARYIMPTAVEYSEYVDDISDKNSLNYDPDLAIILV